MAGDRSQGILGFVGLVAVCTALGYGAWIVLTRPKVRGAKAPIVRVDPAHDSVGFVAVAGEGVDIDVSGPSGARASTRGASAEAARLARSESSVDCPGFADPGGKESACTASINVKTPAVGDYTITVRSQDERAVTLNVGWASASQVRKGAFYVRVPVAARGASAFTIIVARDGVTQRSEPRAIAP